MNAGPDVATVLSAVVMVVGVLAYGLAGARLAVGATEDPLRSAAWWAGTALQGVGFGLTFLARHQLPLLIVQSSVVAALAVTAVVRSLTGRRRLSGTGWAAVAALVVGIGCLGWSTVPGPGRPSNWGLVGLLAGLSLLMVLAVPVVRRLGGPAAAAACGVCSGIGFAVAAVAARLLMGDAAHPLWRFWELPAVAWPTGALVVAGLGAGQWHLTLGLARRMPLATLGLMYLAATVVPALIGWAVLGEHTRPGTGVAVAAGLTLATLGGFVLLRDEAALTSSPGADLS